MPAGFVVEPLDTFQTSIADAVQLAIANDWITPMPQVGLDLATVSLAGDQTPIRNQGDRGTCWAFAGIAALEAAYRRQRGLDLDLSEQYLFHICKAHESDFGNHSLMGFQGASDIVKHMERMRVPLETDAPYLSNATMVATIPSAQILSTAAAPTQEQRDDFEFAPAHVPVAARAACRYGVRTSGVISNFGVGDLETLLTANRDVVVNVTAGGGGHVLLLVGFNRRDRYFLAKNSWGEAGLIRIKYENDPTFAINTSLAHYIIDVIDPAVDVRAGWVGAWHMDHDGWRGRMVVRRFTDLRSGTDAFGAGGATKLGSYYLNGQKFDVNGFFEHGGQSVKTNIAGLGGGGQDFELHIYSNDNGLAAGSTAWAGIPFGARLKRDPIVDVPAKAFEKVDWLGKWEMNHDGWRGVLSLDGISPGTGGVGASYKRSTGEDLGAGGAIRAGQEHALDLTIDFGADNPAQPFTLLYHTRERGLLSGYTTWSNRRFGVQAAKTEDKAAWRTFELAGAGSIATTPNLAAVSRVPGSMEVWWIGPRGSVEAAHWYDGGQWTRYQIAPPNSAAPASGIAAVSRIPESMELWWVGPGGSVEAAYWYENMPWTRYQLAGPGSADPRSGVAAVSRVPGSMEVWWAGPGGSVEAAYWYDGVPWARYQLAPNGSAGGASEIAVLSRVPTSMELWWMSPDGAVDAAYWYEGAPWARYRLADPGRSFPGAGLAAVSRVPGSMEVWWTGAQASVDASYWYEGGAWTGYQIAPAGSTLPGSGVAALSRQPSTMELWWAGADGSLQGAFWYDGGQWARYPLDAAGMVNQPFAATAVSRAGGTMEVWWSGLGGSIRDSYYYDLI